MLLYHVVTSCEELCRKSTILVIGEVTIDKLKKKMRNKTWSPYKNPKSYSNEGVDLICASFLRNVEVGCYIDVGANHPTINSNTYYFYNLGWRGLGIDGNERFSDEWKQARPKDEFSVNLVSNEYKIVDFSIYEDHGLSTISTMEQERYSKRFPQDQISTTRAETSLLAKIKSDYLGDREIHLLSIDVEGEELNVLRGANLSEMLPGVIAVELKCLSLYDVQKSPVVNYLTSLGYRLVGKTPLDSIFLYPQKAYFDWLPETLLSLSDDLSFNT